jgi:hypothetical protein
MSENKNALERHADALLEKLARSVIYQLQRLPEMGAHPYEWDMKSFWNLYAWESQNGPTDDFEMIKDLVEGMCADAIEKMPQHEREFLTEIVTGGQEDGVGASINTEVISLIEGKAGQRNLDRFDPDYLWYENL